MRSQPTSHAALKKIFASYPYKTYQRRLAGISPQILDQLADLYAQDFLREPLAWTLDARDLTMNLTMDLGKDLAKDLPKDSSSTVKVSSHEERFLRQKDIGLGSLRRFSALSSWLGGEAYLLKNFVIDHAWTIENASGPRNLENLLSHSPISPIKEGSTGERSTARTASTAVQNFKNSRSPNKTALNFVPFADRLYRALWQKMNTHLHEYAHSQGRSVDFIAARLPAENTAAIHALLEHGFRFIASEAIYLLAKITPETLPACIQTDLTRIDALHMAERPIRFRLAHKQDLRALKMLIARSPFPSRYRLDGQFSEKVVQKIYKNTLAYSMEHPDHFIALCETPPPRGESGRRKPEILAFISFIRTPSRLAGFTENWGSLDYIVVDPAQRKLGLATLLNAWAVKFLACLDVSLIEVKTLAHNYPSAALLSRSGFSLASLNVLLHQTHKFFK